MRGMTVAARPVARLSSPGEIVAVVPALCGFVPKESLVVISLRGPRKRVGLTMRFDLEWCRDIPTAAAEAARRLRTDGATRAVLVVHSEEPDDAALAWTALVQAVEVTCDSARIDVTDALLVRAGRWWSYQCRADCCPAEGTPVDVAPTAAVQLVQAEGVLDGRAVLGSRAELVASIAPPVLVAAVSARQHLDRAVDSWLDRFAREGREGVRSHGLAVARAALDRTLCAEGLSLPEAAELAIAVQNVHVRDEVATWALTRHDALLSALTQTARLVVPPDDAAVCALLGWVAYAQGDGGLANVALARALTSVPDYSLALLLSAMLQGQVPPQDVRKLLRDTSRFLRR